MSLRAPDGSPGAVIRQVRPLSIAADLGLVPGDRLYEIGGRRPRDYIDYRFLSAEALVELRVIRRDGEEVIFEVEKDLDEDLGLEFTEDIFAGKVRTCANRCVFCFVDRLPPGLRPSLYLKDDDYRLSFLHGNFVTLTNFTAADRDRVLALRLSPLYVSVHATEPELRAAMMGSARAAGIFDQLRELVRGGITVHAQVVVCPGLNDGEHLERTLADLSSLRPGVASAGVVPVGLTRFGPPGNPVRPASPVEEDRLVETALAWHERLGGFVYPADELFLDTGRQVPPARFYGDFPQLQNGIGLARVFLDDLGKLSSRVARGGTAGRQPAGRPAAARSDAPGQAARVRNGGGPFLVVTGALARPLVEAAVKAVSAASGRPGQTVAVRNTFLGESVTVAGLLAGADVERAVTGAAGGAERAARKVGTGRYGQGEGPVLVPGAALRAGTDEFLDGLTLGDLERRTGRRFVDAGWLPSQMLSALGGGEGGPPPEAAGGGGA